MSDPQVFGIFELPLVLLPGERAALHIFEERYKRMISDCLDSGDPFGVVLRDDDGARNVGCEARVDEVLERFDDGRMNIVVSGGRPFRVLDRFEEAEYPAGEVEPIDDPGAAAVEDDPTADATRDAFAELAERATGERPDAAELAAADAYGIAARVELPPETKQALLESRSEDERLEMLGRALGAVREALEKAEGIAERARSNGKVRISPEGPA
jgi:ATP-dependent Lon protease